MPYHAFHCCFWSTVGPPPLLPRSTGASILRARNPGFSTFKSSFLSASSARVAEVGTGQRPVPTHAGKGPGQRQKRSSLQSWEEGGKKIKIKMPGALAMLPQRDHPDATFTPNYASDPQLGLQGGSGGVRTKSGHQFHHGPS